MDKLFLTILNMSLTGAFVITAICLVRLPLKKAPKVISYYLWVVAGFRLVFPFSIESIFSLIPFKAQTIPPDIAMQPIPHIDSGIPFVNNAVSSILPAATSTASVNPLQIWTTVGAFVWLIGVAVMLIYGERRIIGGSPLAFGEGGVKGRIKNVLNFKKPSRIIIVAVVALVAVLSVGLTVNRISDEDNYDIPNIIATETIDGAQATALYFGYSWHDSKNSVNADAIAPWQGEYTDKNTLVIDGEMGQNRIAISAENPITANYEIYLPDGTLYDNGTRDAFDSLSPRLYWTDDKTGIGIIAPFEPGEYIYAVTIGWEKDDLKVTYGIKLIMTGKHNAYDDALSMIRNHYNDVISVSFKGVETLPDAEYAGDCYVFDVELPDGMEQVAISKDKGIFFTYSNGIWWMSTITLSYKTNDVDSSVSK